jgi:hypothetical protein
MVEESLLSGCNADCNNSRITATLVEYVVDIRPKGLMLGVVALEWGIKE